MRSLVFLSALWAPAAQADPLFTWEIEAAFVDRAFAYALPDAGATRQGIIAYRADGKTLIRGPGGYEDAGVWRVSNHRLCMSATPIENGREFCQKVDPIGDKYILTGGLELLPLADLGFLDQ